MSAAVAKFRQEPIGKILRECPICESTQLEYEFLVEKTPVCGCKTCGLLFLNPQPDEPGSVTPTEQSSFAPDILEANAAERIKELIKYAGVRSGRILLVGADSPMISEAVALGFEVLAYSSREFEHLPSSQYPDGLELALVFCSLERMRDPLGALKSVRQMLEPSGSLMVVSAITDSPAAHVFRSSWWGFNRSTLFYFSTDTLQNLLSKAGFGEPIIVPDRSLVSLNYLEQRLSSSSRSAKRYRALKLLTKLSPFFRNKAFRLSYGRTRLLVRSKAQRLRPVLSVIVPVYNEQATFVELIDQLLAKSIEGVDMEVIIVESKSSDGTRELVLEYKHHPRVNLILEEKPRGKGHAVRTGLAAATGDVVLFQDADLEYDINDYDALIAPILRFESNFVLGTRHSTGKNSWKIREFSDAPGLASFFNFGHLLFLTLFNVIYRQKLSDPFTMFKVFRRDCLWGLNFECNRFDFDYEIVIKLLRKGYKVFELPVNYRSRSIQEGKKVTVFRDPLTWIRALIKFRNSPLYESPEKSTSKDSENGYGSNR